MELRSRGTGSENLYSQLLDTLLNSSDVESFKNLVECLKRDKLDINHNYDFAPHFGTLLDIACREKNKSEFVKVLLDNGADANLVNEVRREAPLHFAVRSSDIRTLDCLLKSPRTEVNIKDVSGCTPLHLACKLGQLEQVESLLNHPKVKVNVLNIKEKAPVQLALEMNNESIVSKLLKHEDIDIDFIKPSSGETIRESISKRLPQLEPVLLTVRKRDQNRVNMLDPVDKLFFYLRKFDVSSFENLVKENENLVNSDDGGHTFLQFACAYGLYDFVKILVDSGADINHTIPSNKETGLMIACKQGYHRIVSLLMNQNSVSLGPVDRENILFLVIKNFRSDKSHLLYANNDKRDHLKCLEEILKKEHLERLDINQQDSIGNTVLHYAAKKSAQDIIISLLDNGAYIGTRNKFDDPPLAYISPKILEAYLDRCVYDDKELLAEYEIIFNYNFLVPPKMSTPTGDVESLETGPLLYMSTSSKLRPLLMHPVLTSYLHIKWHSFRHLLYCNLGFYGLFCLLLTTYIFIWCHTVEESNGNKDEGNSTNSTTCTNSTSSGCISNPTFEESWLWWPLLVFLGLHILQESIRVFLLSVSPSRTQHTITVEYLLKIALIIVTSIILVKPKGVRNMISAVGILCSWTELLLLFGRYTSLSLSTSIAMFKTVTESFFKFLKLFSILLLAFAFSFYLLFQDNEFSDPYSSVLKTLVMMTGEFDYSNIPFGQQQNHASAGALSQAASHILFVLFVFLVAVVLVNLLNGLAVSDTQAIQKDAELVAYASRVELISYIERMVLQTLVPIQDFAKRTPCLCCCVPKCFLECKPNLLDKQSPSSDNKIHVLPNEKNKVRVSRVVLDEGYVWNSRLKDCKNIMMKESIVRAAEGVLQKRCEETDKTHQVAAALVRKSKRREIRKRLDEYGLRLEKLEALTQQSQIILSEIFKMTEKESQKPSS